MPPRNQPRNQAARNPPVARSGPTRTTAAGTAPQPQTQTGVFVPPAAHVTPVGVIRPGYGTSGQEVVLNVNFFTTTVSTGIIYHYDVVISPDTKSAKMNARIIGALQGTVAPATFANGHAGFDGRKNIFSPIHLDLGGDSRQFDVIFPSTNPDRPPTVYKVRLTFAATINPENLLRFIGGLQSQDNASLTALTAYNVAMRAALLMQQVPMQGRSIFDLAQSTSIGSGLVVVRGFFQSLRPAVGRLLVNVDTSTAIMYCPGRLIDLCLERLGLHDARQLTSAMHDRQKRELQGFLKGLRVKTKAANEPLNAEPRGSARAVVKLSQLGANELTFEMRGGGGIMTVADYFRRVSGRALQYPQLLCVEVGKGALIPLELCTVPEGQFCKKELPERAKSEAVKLASQKPGERLASIRGAHQVLQYGQSEYMREFGIAVDNQLLSVPGRILPAPQLKYGSNKNPAAVNVTPRDGAWNMADKRFIEPMTIEAWVFIILESQNRFSEAVAAEVEKGFVKGLEKTGMTFTDPKPIIKRVNGNADIPASLYAAGKQCFTEKKAPTLFLIVIPPNSNHLYTIVKRWGDITQGVATQCVISTKCTRANDQFWANIALKTNLKLGGTNVHVPLLSDPREPTIIMGADVMHPGAGSSRPSFSAVVCSVDPQAAKYTATMRVQTSKQELISDLQDMVKEVLQRYKSVLNKARKLLNRSPSRLIFYRDGVSEGQFQQVKDQELPKIQAACREVGYNPNITLVIVGKRHHAKFFPQNPGDADRSGNARAGTVVDREIVHPFEFDFYLLSHSGILGTSRSSHYTVLYDENKFNADKMQQFSYALCHVYARATRSVSIPAPVYYADIVCSRAKIHYAPIAWDALSDSQSQAGSADDADSLTAFKRDFSPVNKKLEMSMNFT
ncbi:argonaute-like protein [Roridomyces roridus]|uniref:Argonaute-like protein n=1 Tax=Roridomyces roridus TaxID=1738132 RepID=A0AAD7B7G1_9AGAR|nr:argonaute-like protein [Roridomyces roridus]